MLDELRRWIALADERMPPLGIEVYVMAGNDDPWSCDAVLADAAHTSVLRRSRNARRRARDDLVLLRQPDALEQPARARRGRAVRPHQGLAEQLERPETAIFNLHVPPYDSGSTRPRDRRQLASSCATASRTRSRSARRRFARSSRSTSPALAARAHPRIPRRGADRAHARAQLRIRIPSGRIHGVTVSLAGEQVRSHQFTIG